MAFNTQNYLSDHYNIWHFKFCN